MVLTGKRAESACANRHLAVPQWLGTARHSLLVVDVMSATPSVSPDTCSAYICPEDACSIKVQSFCPSQFDEASLLQIQARNKQLNCMLLESDLGKGILQLDCVWLVMIKMN